MGWGEETERLFVFEGFWNAMRRSSVWGRPEGEGSQGEVGGVLFACACVFLWLGLACCPFPLGHSSPNRSFSEILYTLISASCKII